MLVTFLPFILIAIIGGAIVLGIISRKYKSKGNGVTKVARNVQDTQTEDPKK
jgi:hypothetical protein